MVTNKKLGYITQKIVETKVAILSCYTSGLLKIPNNIINTIHVDDKGQIWFFVGRPMQLISQFEPEFAVTLNYFKKGLGYYMNILGNGKLITDIDEISSIPFLHENEKMEAIANNVLMCVKILNVEYHMSASSVGTGLWNKVKSHFAGIQVFEEGRNYDFTTPYQ